jgi:4-diphosphocytidyl-2-C-methyl-D-erythritol kinase
LPVDHAPATAFAAAKVNLFLHVGPARADGFHPLSSLMAFADVGDRLTIEPAERLALTIDGPFAAGLDAGGDNLVIRAARAVLAACGREADGFRIRLDKQLPLAAGLGGGSSDAGAALRLINRWLSLGLTDEALTDIAANLGADGAACLSGRPIVAEGRGERLSAPPPLPMLDAVLVNPMAASPTGAVYRAFDTAGARGGADRPRPPAQALDTPMAAAAWLARQRNDLEAPAIGLVPQIGEAMALLRGRPETLLARVSGSGATCFALCANGDGADRLAAGVRELRPGWWIRRCRLGGPWPDAG